MAIKPTGTLTPQQLYSSLAPAAPQKHLAQPLTPDGFQQRQVVAGLVDQGAKGQEIRQLTQQLAPGMNPLEKASVRGDLKEVAGHQKENAELLKENAQLSGKAQQGGVRGFMARREIRENTKEVLENNREIKKEQGEALGKLRHEAVEQQTQGFFASIGKLFGF
jgi:hypothetical protein